MDNFEYLQHISQSNRPVKPARKPFPFAIIIKVLLSILVVVIVIIAINVLVTSGGKQARSLTRQLYTRMNTTNQAISNYNGYIKSSQLRSIGYSLSSTLTGSSNQLSRYISHNFTDQENPYTLSSDVYAIESKASSNLNTTLRNARLNGLLDRIYAKEMQLQVAVLMSMSSELLSRDPDQTLRNILDAFYANLNTIEQSLDNFSNPNA